MKALRIVKTAFVVVCSVTLMGAGGSSSCSFSLSGSGSVDGVVSGSPPGSPDVVTPYAFFITGTYQATASSSQQSFSTIGIMSLDETTGIATFSINTEASPQLVCSAGQAGFPCSTGPCDMGGWPSPDSQLDWASNTGNLTGSPASAQWIGVTCSYSGTSTLAFSGCSGTAVPAGIPDPGVILNTIEFSEASPGVYETSGPHSGLIQVTAGEAREQTLPLYTAATVQTTSSTLYGTLVEEIYTPCDGSYVAGGTTTTDGINMMTSELGAWTTTAIYNVNPDGTGWSEGLTPTAHTGQVFVIAGAGEVIYVLPVTLFPSDWVDDSVAIGYAMSCPANAGEALCAAGGPPACTDTSTDVSNCGSCGNACPSGQTCAAGMCSCTAGLTACGGACVDTSSDSANCGSCGNACGSGQACTAGLCSCLAGLTLCGSACVDTSSDSSNCGSCGNACTSPQTCSGGMCM
jgi:hypothetical protein